MKSIAFSVFLILFLNAAAQVHPCAESKIHAAIRPLHKSSTLALDRLMNEYDVTFHHLDLKVERDTTTLSGNVRTIAKVVSPSGLDTFGFELYSSHTIDSVELMNGTNLIVTHNVHAGYVIMPAHLNQGDVVDLRIYYHGTPPKAQSAAIGAGFSSANSGRWGNRATWSLSQPYSAYEWWPCKNSLQDKIDSTYTWITTSSDNKAGSNGTLQRITSLPNSKVRYEWRSTYPIDCYLISVAVAKYVEYKTYAHFGATDSMLIQDYIYDNPNTLSTFKPILDQTASMIEAFSAHFGKYPFANEKYGHAMAPFSGGMEHQTMTTLGIIDFGIVAHELGHQWFGDHVTCETWKDIWLNEGFASYIEYLALEWLNPGAEVSQIASVHNTVEGLPNGSIAISDTTNVNRVFDSRLTYNKGSAMIHMIRYVINNDSIFFHFLKSYQQQFGYATATTNEFKALLESISGIDFTQFFTQWYYGEGYPSFNFSWNQLGATFYLRSIQTTSTNITTLFKTPVTLKLFRDNNTDTLIRININQNNMNFSFAVGGTISAVLADPNDWLLGKFTAIHDLNLSVDNDLSSDLKLTLYPNPALDVLNILCDKKIKHVTITDLTGREIMNTSTSPIQLSRLEQGVYFAKVFSVEGQSKTISFIKE